LSQGIRPPPQIGAGALDPSSPSVRYTHWFISRDETLTVHQIDADGSVEDILPRPRDNATRRYSRPGLEPGETRVQEKISSGATNGHAIIRAVASILLFARENGRDMSADVDIGFTAGRSAYHFQEPAAWVQTASDEQILSRLRPPPRVGPYPPHPAEDRMGPQLAPAEGYALHTS
jgi:hypothetical protein